MAEFIKVNATENDPITRWINLDAVMVIARTKVNEGERLTIKFIDSTSLVLDGECAELALSLDLLSVNDQLPD
jgi:hypothetical protein